MGPLMWRKVLLVALMCSYPVFSVAEAGSSLKLFYLHGKIVEDKGDLAVHPRYGTYRYSDIVAAFGAGIKTNDGTVVSEIRAINTQRVAYAETLARQINTLIDKGTPAESIVVVGFSKGAQIAILLSQKLNQPQVRFVLQAVCGSWTKAQPELQVVGDVLSMYEKSDGAGSCGKLLARTQTPSCEISFNTGLGHGLFYQPREVWLNPLLNWLDSGQCAES